MAGKQAGLGKGTRSGLLYECEKIIEAKKPKYLLLENVKNLVGKKFKPEFDKWLQYLEGLGYTNYWKVLNAKDYGVPQNRERVFVVSILGYHKPYEFANKIPLDKCIADILEDEVDEKYYLSEEIQKRFKLTNQNKNIIGTTKPDFRTIGQRDLVYDKNGVMGALVATDYKQPKQIAEVERLGGIFDDEKGKHQAGSIYDKNKCCPTLDTMQGGYRQPLIIDTINVIGKLDCKGWHDIETRVYDTNGVSPTIETRNRGKYLTVQDSNRQFKILEHKICQNVKVRKYDVDTDKLKKALKDAKNKSGLTIKDISSKLDKNKTTVEHWFRSDNCFSIPDEDIWLDLKKLLGITTDEFDKSIMEFEIKPNEYDMSNRVYEANGISPTLTASGESGAKKIIEYKERQIELPCICASRGRNPNNPSSRVAGEPTEQQLEINIKGTSNTITTVQKDNYVVEETYRIRKLTPRECFRLMGMKDDDIDKIQRAGISNTQQYKMAGNSIVINVLEAIFKELFL